MNVEVEEDGNEPLALESFDDYVRRHGLLNALDGEEPGGEFNGLNREEAIEQVRIDDEYLLRVIEKHQEGTTSSLHDEQDAAQVQPIDEREGFVSLLLSNKSTFNIPVQPLVAFCDTALKMVDSRERYGIVEGSSSSILIHERENKQEGPIIAISLVEFDADATMEFVCILTILWQHRLQLIISESVYRKQRTSSYEMEERIANVCRTSLIDEGKISEQNIVECLRLAHYLQCRVILNTLTTILESSIDSRNCMAMCSLADSLNLKSLFEASINYVIERLDAFQGASTEDGVDTETISSDTNGDDNIEVWTSLPHELRSRIMTMRNVMRSSVIGRGSKVSGLFFSSGAEFLAIFRETIREMNERLQEAKERSQEVIRERTELWQRRGRWLSDSETDFIYGGEVAYCLEKIQNQSRRLKTLEKFYDEQKTIFEGNSFESGIML